MKKRCDNQLKSKIVLQTLIDSNFLWKIIIFDGDMSYGGGHLKIVCALRYRFHIDIKMSSEGELGILIKYRYLVLPTISVFN